MILIAGKIASTVAVMLAGSLIWHLFRWLEAPEHSLKEIRALEWLGRDIAALAALVMGVIIFNIWSP